ncbi:MAG: hypothetical protein SFW09_17365 [Hyphomicrobiaceae bacterium]|nr:hypothetical protein [Hyphomicrobiaceae bacterium]
MPGESVAGDRLARPGCGPVLRLQVARGVVRQRQVVIAVDGEAISQLTVKPSLGVRRGSARHDISLPVDALGSRRPLTVTARDSSTGRALPGSPLTIGTAEHPLRHGHVDQVDGAFVIGWAMQIPLIEPTRISVTLKDGVTVPAVANSFRPDILALFDVPRAGFRVSLPPANGEACPVAVNIGSWTLPGSGRVWTPQQQALARHYRALALFDGVDGVPGVGDVEAALAFLKAHPDVATANPLTTVEIARAALAVAVSLGELAAAALVFEDPTIRAGAPLLDGRTIEVIRCLIDEADGSLLDGLLDYLKGLRRPHSLADILALRVELRRATTREAIRRRRDTLAAKGQEINLGTPLRSLAIDAAMRASARI